MTEIKSTIVSTKRILSIVSVFLLVVVLSIFTYKLYIKSTNQKKDTAQSIQNEDSVAKNNDLEYTYKIYKNEDFEATLPILINYKDISTMATVNQDISSQIFGCYDGYSREDLIEEINFRKTQYSSKDLSLMSEKQLKQILGWQMTIATSSDVYAKNDIFSFALNSISYNCKGVVNSQGEFVTGYTYDLVSGKLLAYEDIFLNVKDSSLIKLFTDAYNNSPDDSGECPDKSDSNAHVLENNFTNFYLEKNDFVVPKTPPTDIHFCHSDTDIHIPIAVLEPYIKDTSILKKISKQK